MSVEKSNVAPSRPAPKPRNPVERVIVWGFIGVMLVLVVIEAIPWYSHRQALAGLRQRLEAADQDTASNGVYENDVKAAMGSRQPTTVEDLRGTGDVNGASRRDVYTWFTLSPIAKRQIYVYYGYAGKNDNLGPEVLEVAPDEQRAARVAPITVTPEEEEERKKRADAVMQMGGGGGPGGGGGGGRGQGGGRGKRQRPPAAHAEEPNGENPTEGSEAKPTEEPENPAEPKKEQPPDPTAPGEEKPAE